MWINFKMIQNSTFMFDSFTFFLCDQCGGVVYKKSFKTKNMIFGKIQKSSKFEFFSKKKVNFIKFCSFSHFFSFFSLFFEKECGVVMWKLGWWAIRRMQKNNMEITYVMSNFNYTTNQTYGSSDTSVQILKINATFEPAHSARQPTQRKKKSK